MNILSFLHIFYDLLEIVAFLWYPINIISRSFVMRKKEKEKSSTIVFRILFLSCMIYAPICFIINLICTLSVARSFMLSPWAGALIFLICGITSIVVVLKGKFKKINTPLNVFKIASISFTILSFVIATVSLIIENGQMWNLYGLLDVFVFSLVIACIKSFVKLKSYLVNSLIYYAASITAFMLLTTVIANYNESNIAMLLFGGFTLAYIIIAIFYFFVRRSFASYDNEDKEYKPMFN